MPVEFWGLLHIYEFTVRQYYQSWLKILEGFCSIENHGCPFFVAGSITLWIQCSCVAKVAPLAKGYLREVDIASNLSLCKELTLSYFNLFSP